MPITANGFVSKTEEEYYNLIVQSMVDQFPNMATRDDNPMIVIAKFLAKELGNIEYFGQSSYNNAYVSTASGFHLDKAVRISGISRLDGTVGFVDVTFSRNPEYTGDVVIPANVRTTIGDLTFTGDNGGAIILDTTTTSTVIQCVCDAVGAIEAGANSMTTQSPIAGLLPLTHAIVDSGTDTETDDELRERYFVVISTYNNSSLKGVIGYVNDNALTTVTTGRENVTTVTDADGLPPKSIEIFVAGGTDESVATAIFESKPAGIETHGSESFDITYSGKTYTIKFSRITEIPIYVDLSLNTLSTFPTDGTDTLKTAIQKYIDSSNVINKTQLERIIYTSVEGIDSIASLKFDDVNPPTNTSNMSSGVSAIFTSDIADIVITT